MENEAQLPLILFRVLAWPSLVGIEFSFSALLQTPSFKAFHYTLPFLFLYFTLSQYASYAQLTTSWASLPMLSFPTFLTVAAKAAPMATVSSQTSIFIAEDGGKACRTMKKA